MKKKLVVENQHAREPGLVGLLDRLNVRRVLTGRQSSRVSSNEAGGRPRGRSGDDGTIFPGHPSSRTTRTPTSGTHRACPKPVLIRRC